MKELATSPYKYVEICDMILARIATGELSAGSRLPSARALGEEFGCNYHTVRRAFEKLATQGYLELKHGSGTFVSQTAGDLNTPKVNNGKELRATDKIGVLLPLKQWGHYVTSLIDHLHHSAEKKKIKLNVRAVPEIDAHSAELSDDFIKHDCCAIILPWLGEDQNLSDLHDFARASALPVVLANPVPGLEASCYLDPTVDLRSSQSIIYLQCRYFKEIGYKKIALLGPDTVGADYWQRNLMLYSRWCDIEAFPNLVGMVDRSPRDYGRIIKRWETHKGELAVIAYHDEIAMEFMQACEQKGFSVPGDFAVLGHNNNPLGLRSNPPLSTLFTSYEYITEGLLEHAIALSKGASKQLDGHEPYDFFIRESCGGRLKFGDDIEDIVSSLLARTNEPEAAPRQA